MIQLETLELFWQMRGGGGDSRTMSTDSDFDSQDEEIWSMKVCF